MENLLLQLHGVPPNAQASYFPVQNSWQGASPDVMWA
jgi:hypothetical protein